MISYDELKTLYRTEKESPELQKVPADFYEQVKDMLCAVDERYRENITDLFREIYGRRLGKILRATLRNLDDGKPPANITPHEETLYQELHDVLARHEKDISTAVTGACPPPPEEKPVRHRAVRMRKALPAFVGADMTEYGPYKVDDTAELPAENADILIAQRMAEAA